MVTCYDTDSIQFIQCPHRQHLVTYVSNLRILYVWTSITAHKEAM